MDEHKIKIVLSAPNCTSGGILSISQDLLKELCARGEFDITAIVNSKELFEGYGDDNVRFMEFPDSKESWSRRLKYEYREFFKLSQELQPDIWLSMHDITPNVCAKFLATYCHNPTPFYKFRFKDFLYDKKFGLFVLFYRYLYGINIRKNDHVFVQQNWIKQAFEKMFKIDNVVVAKPDIEGGVAPAQEGGGNPSFTFFYPSFPRPFKNFEILCKAADYLAQHHPEVGFKLLLTIDGTENQYAKDVVDAFSHVENIEFLGLLPREEVFEHYAKCDAFLFPSKLETWGLPISEVKDYGKPMIVSDLPYAKETVGDYDAVNFFPPDDHEHLARIMMSHIEGRPQYDGNSYENSDDLIGWPQFIEFVKSKYLTKSSA